MPAARASIVNADAKCSQKPRRVLNRKSSTEFSSQPRRLERVEVFLVAKLGEHRCDERLVAARRARASRARARSSARCGRAGSRSVRGAHRAAAGGPFTVYVVADSRRNEVSVEIGRSNRDNSCKSEARAASPLRPARRARRARRSSAADAARASRRTRTSRRWSTTSCGMNGVRGWRQVRPSKSCSTGPRQ